MDVRTRILDAAFNLLYEHGVGELTQPKVSRAAGIRQSHLTYYFPTRNDLLLAVAQHSLTVLLGQLNEESAREPAARFDRVIAAIGQGITDKRRARVMLGVIAASDEDPRIKAWLRDFVGQVRDGLSSIFAMLGIQLDRNKLALCHSLGVGLAVLNLGLDDDASRYEAQDLLRLILRLLVDDDGAGAVKLRHPGGI